MSRVKKQQYDSNINLAKFHNNFRSRTLNQNSTLLYSTLTNAAKLPQQTIWQTWKLNYKKSSNPFYCLLNINTGWWLFTLIMLLILLVEIVQGRRQFIVQRLDHGRLQKFCGFLVNAALARLPVVFQQGLYVASRHVVGNQLLYEVVGGHYRTSLLLLSLAWLDSFK